MTPGPPTRSRWGRHAAIGLGLTLLAAIAAASIGAGSSPVIGATALLYLLPIAGFAPVLYLAAAFGIGIPLSRWLAPRSQAPFALAMALGLAAMLSITHAMGVLGVLSNRMAAVVPVALGLAMLLRLLPTLLVALRAAPTPSPVWLAAVPAVGVLLAAACNPPGWLWASEFGGYDALSYHLQLPREWHANGRVWPLEHNVYSYLPSYLEAAFVHLASLIGAPRDAFVTAEGTPLIACQLLHSGITLIAGWIMAAAVRVLSLRRGHKTQSGIAGTIAGVLVIATPWSVVTGSLAYNEMGVLLLVGGALLVAVDSHITPVRRGLLAGLLVGAACGCKPTALLFGAPVIALALAGGMTVNRWPAAFAVCAVAGALMLAPWLVRNAMASGNPVFPQLTGVFGTGHWTPEQADRYAAGHTFDGSLADAAALLVRPDPHDPAARPGYPVHRGLAHPQWAFAGPLFLVSVGLGVALRSTRRWALLLAGGVGCQLLAWALLTHVQSRFLIPLLVPIAALAGLVVAAAMDHWREKPVVRVGALVLSVVVLLSTSAVTVRLFAIERQTGGGPNAWLAFGPAAFLNPTLVNNDPALMSPDMYLSTQLPAGSRLLLLGDATPLYKPMGTLYATTWDTSPAAEALSAWPDEPEIAAAELGEIATHVYFDAAEAARLASTGWADPALDPQRIAEMLTRGTTLVHAFPDQPRALFRLPRPTGTLRAPTIPSPTIDQSPSPSPTDNTQRERP